MSGATSIEWCDASWSPVVGCTRVSAGCDNCYAVRQTRRLEAMGKEKYAGLVGAGKSHFNGTARLHAPSLDWPLRWRGSKKAKAEGRPSRIFVNPMSDLYHENLTDAEIAAVYGVMAACPQHVFQVLTKRPERRRIWFEDIAARPGMVEHAEVRACSLQLLTRWTVGRQPASVLAATRPLSAGDCPPWPLPNVWEGVSVEDQATADERIRELMLTPAALRFVSLEPQLAAVDLLHVHVDGGFVDALRGARPAYAPIDWLIVGGESGPGARPFDIAWARSVIRQGREAGVPVFVKQLGAWPFAIGTHTRDGLRQIRNRKGNDRAEWPEDLRVREFPA